jgi:tetratricopeptide (TPR) repeat protein
MTQTVAEHRMYLPLAAVILLTVLAVYAVSDPLLAKGRIRPAVPVIRSMALVAVAVVLGAAALHRNRDYASELTLWSDTFAKRPQNVRAAVYLGAALMNQNNSNPPPEAMSLALERFKDAISIDSAYGLAYANRGLAYYRMKRFDEALRDYDKAIAVQASQQGNRAELFNNRGILLGETGRTADAVADFNAAVRLMPDFSSAHSNLGSAYTILANAHAAKGDTALAAEAYRQSIAGYSDAIRYDPKSTAAYRGRASTYGRLGRFAEAAEDCSAIIRFEPADAVAWSDRAICYYQTGRYQEAWRDVQECRNRGGMPNTELILLLAKATGQSK